MPDARAFCAMRAISSSIFLPVTIIRSASSSMTTTMNGISSIGSGASGVSVNGIGQRLAGLLRLDDPGVVPGEVAHAERAHQLVAALHLAHAPVERVAGELHVGDDRREQVRNALVDRQLQHLRVDQDQAHLLRLGLVQQRQDHRVDRDRLAGARGARDQQVRHPREVGDDRLAGDVLAQRQRQHAGGVVVRRRGEDLDQLDDLALRIRQLEAHARLAGDRLDDADADDRQRPRQVLHQVDDLRALDADRGLDLVAGDHRSRIGGQHLHRDAEVGELALDEPRGELQRFGRHDRVARRRRVVEQRQRRQRRVGQLLEQRPLPLLRRALRFLHLDHRRHDDDRLALGRLVALLLDDRLAERRAPARR